MHPLELEIKTLTVLSARAYRTMDGSKNIQERELWMSVSNEINESLFKKKELLEQVRSLEGSV